MVCAEDALKHAHVVKTAFVVIVLLAMPVLWLASRLPHVFANSQTGHADSEGEKLLLSAPDAKTGPLDTQVAKPGLSCSRLLRIGKEAWHRLAEGMQEDISPVDSQSSGPGAEEPKPVAGYGSVV
uniref:Uncharacterized protein n=1 Tax=Alexandrium monilatum TaxID=311494 RepID=A0A6T0VY21_9DINO|mmetsp:Transcript_71589/g.213636  ORF Transcript_71589/g.213636 Transcript_71589/m.213636 type:complete len:125 (+) Transcript_71589:119-493(+)